MGHGHVFPRPDGLLARCGGPAACPVCREEAAEAARLREIQKKVPGRDRLSAIIARLTKRPSDDQDLTPA